MWSTLYEDISTIYILNSDIWQYKITHFCFHGNCINVV